MRVWFILSTFAHRTFFFFVEGFFIYFPSTASGNSFPIGNEKYINKCLQNITNKVNECFKLLETNIQDIQTVGQIFCNSLIQKFYYTLCANVFQNGDQCENIFDYNSQHCGDINKTFNRVIKFLIDEKITLPHVKELTERPTSQNGIHLLNPCKSAISAACAPVIKSIQIASKGIPVKDNYIMLPKSIRRYYKNWTIKQNNIFNTLNKHITQMIEIIQPEKVNAITPEEIK